MSEQASEEAVRHYRVLANRNPDAHLPDLAGTLNNYAIQLAESDRLDEAQRAADEALGIYRELAARDPDAYLPG
ncbi:hypothetical protein, partial [Microbispora rosea]|uniref:hypothetical protein n=1 Tax=Microbispora rosea TaxID=58117 RepID=UPI003418242A